MTSIVPTGISLLWIGRGIATAGIPNISHERLDAATLSIPTGKQRRIPATRIYQRCCSEKKYRLRSTRIAFPFAGERVVSR